MDWQFWTEVGAAALTAVIAGGAVGGVFWTVLGKGIEARVSKLLEQHKTDLAAQLHLQNTVHSRLDERRSDAVQKLNAHIRTHKWEVTGFNPHAWSVTADADIGLEAMKWWLERQRESHVVIRMGHDLSLLIPEELMHNVGGWGMLAQQLVQESMRRIMHLGQQQAYLAADAPVAGIRVDLLT
jgi:hypothetical protein